MSVSPKDMFVRGTVWYVHIHTYDPQTADRDSFPWSTGIKIAGKKGTRTWQKAKDRAMIEASKHALQVTLGTHNSNMTIKDAYNANFAAKVGKKCAPGTFEILSEKWPHISRFFGDKTLLKTITDQDLIDYVTDAATGHRTCRCKTGKQKAEAPRAPGSIARELKELFYGLRILGIHPLPEFPEVGQMNKNGTRDDLGRVKFAKLLAHTAPQWREHLLAYRLTGVRKAELYLIEAQHVDLEEGMLTVPGSDSVNGDKPRKIPIHEQLVPVLQHRMEMFPTGPLFEAWHNADRDIREAGVRAQVGVVSFNVLKASFGGDMLRAGVATREVAEFYGHTSTRMVEEHYNRLQAGKHLKGALSKVKFIPLPTDTTDEE